MNDAAPTPSMRKFIDYFGELGARWGLDGDACRVHAYLYLAAHPATENDIASALAFDAPRVSRALGYLSEWQMVTPSGAALWSVGADPWQMLFSGLEERRRRELEPALATLRECRADAVRDAASTPSVRHRIGRVLDLVEDLAAIDLQARRLSPNVMRSVIGLTGRAARFMDRTLGTRRRGRHDD
jgi:DNA-binding transcriptional regulator GbsR (MarR family)